MKLSNQRNGTLRYVTGARAIGEHTHTHADRIATRNNHVQHSVNRHNLTLILLFLLVKVNKTAAELDTDQLSATIGHW